MTRRVVSAAAVLLVLVGLSGCGGGPKGRNKDLDRPTAVTNK